MTVCQCDNYRSMVFPNRNRINAQPILQHQEDNHLPGNYLFDISVSGKPVYCHPMHHITIHLILHTVSLSITTVYWVPTRPHTDFREHQSYRFAKLNALLRSINRIIHTCPFFSTIQCPLLTSPPYVTALTLTLFLHLDLLKGHDCYNQQRNSTTLNKGIKPRLSE